MLRASLLLALVMLTDNALPCSDVVGGVAAAQAEARRDRDAQRVQVAELTAQADAILLASAQRVEESANGTTAQFQAKEVLKGTLQVGDLVTYSLPGMVMIGCDVASMFKNTLAIEGVTYLIYVREGRLLRTGELRREWPEISLREEMRRIRKLLEGA